MEEINILEYDRNTSLCISFLYLELKFPYAWTASESCWMPSTKLEGLLIWFIISSPSSLSPCCMSQGVQPTRTVYNLLKAVWCGHKCMYESLHSFLVACIHSFIYLLSNIVLGQIQTQFFVPLVVFTEYSSL